MGIPEIPSHSRAAIPIPISVPSAILFHPNSVEFSNRIPIFLPTKIPASHNS